MPEAFKKSGYLTPSLLEYLFMQGQTIKAWWQENREQSE